ncbi:hypothetical protein [Olivibacter jilunii]|uniref:hypothetical protein n=1 Tax=Olivibacter jilunii TaxID=985016 RepID=UPI001030336C|nr:hypothetical protein [Olivibacter jilunii]
MKTTVIGNNKENGKVSTTAVTKENKSEQPKANGLPLSKGFDDKPKGEATKESVSTVPAQAEQPKEEVAPKTETITSEPTKKELKASIAAKIAEQKAILERHIELGDKLNRKIRHRDNLTAIITTLKEFEVSLKDNEEETENNHFQGCLLTIQDDKGKTFTTKNPTLIKEVAEDVKTFCTDKLRDVDLDIINLIPA